jgi:pyruvate,water dikinase
MGEGVCPSVVRIEAGVSLPAVAGGKARGLQAILRAGLPVPDAWIVPTGTGEAAVRELARELEQRGVRWLAVRSSAIGEDEHDASFAGIHESRLGIAPADLIPAVRAVASSSLSERASAYRRELGIGPATGPCAVVVQILVAADRAGVAFGLGEANDAVVVEAVRGLGEALVQGRGSPETWEAFLRKGEWSALLRRRSRQAVSVVADARGTRSVDLPDEEAGAPVLTKEQVSEIAVGVHRLQAASGVPLDVEWCMGGESLFLLQARPRTRPLGALSAGQIWTRSNFRDVLPDIATALTRSFAQPSLEGALEDYYRTFGIPEGRKAPLVDCIYGRLVSNESVLLELLELLGIPRSIPDVSVGGGEGGADRFEPMDLRLQARHPILMLRSIANALRAPGRAQRFMKGIRRLGERIRSRSLPELADEELLRIVGPSLVATGKEFAACALHVVAALQGLQYRMASLLRAVPHPGAILTRLVAPHLDTVSTRLTEDLTELAIAFRRWEGGAGFFAELTEAHRGPSPWEERLPPELFDRTRAWMDRYGHRGPWESDLAFPRYREDWRMLARLLEPMVASGKEPESPDARRARREEAAERAWSEVRDRVGACKRWLIRRGVRDLAKLLALREELRSETGAAMFHVRTVLLEAGRRLEERGRLAAREDLWDLDIGELGRALRDPRFDAAGAVARERGRRAAWRRIEVPNRFRSEDVPGFRYLPHAGGAPALRLAGTGISPGLAEGRSRRLETPEDGAALEAGEILVAHTTDPGWTPLFARAGGILVEMGGTLSHAGIVAREFGIPCVSNVEGIMRRIRDGQLLRIDGTRGEVEVLAGSCGPVHTGEKRSVPV